MRERALGVVGVVVGLAAVSIVVIALTRDAHPLGRSGTHSVHRVHTHPALAPSAALVRSSRLTRAGWATIKQAAHLRRMALQPGRTAQYRAFAAYMGLSGLVSLHPILPGRCADAVRDLYDNLLDLLHAYTGEDWTALRRAVAAEPSLRSCAPRPGVQYVG